MSRPLLPILLLLASCHRAPPAAFEPQSARQVVERFFVAAEAGDCAKLAPMMVAPERCEHLVKEFHDTKTHFEGITEAKPDGRDRSTMLVFTTVAFDKKSGHKWIVRAIYKDGDWKVTL